MEGISSITVWYMKDNYKCTLESDTTVYFQSLRDNLEIAFYEKLVNKLELALNIPHNEIKYDDMSKKAMMEFFNKDLKSIDMAISKMCHRYNKDMKYIEDGIIFIKAEGVKYINEKYYRKSYLKYLEDLKRKLEVEYDKHH